MARIRTIKPDFWTDEKIVELSFEARLFFIGSWNFADDNGNLQRSARKLKMQIFPADAIDCEPVIQSLIAHGLLIEYFVNGETFLHIKGFKAHQVINRPSKTGLPGPESSSTPAPLTEPSLTEGKGEGKEGNGREEERKGKEEDKALVEPEPPLEPPPAPPAFESIPTSRGAAISLLMRSNGVEGCNASNPIVQEWAENPRVSDDLLLTAAKMAKDRDVLRPGPNYLKPIIEQLLNPPKPKPKDDWHRTDAGIGKKAKEMGVSARAGWTFAQLKDAVWDEIRRKERQGEAA